MGKNSQYKEVKEFTVEQYKYEKCTSDKFSAAFGIEACLKFNRPLVGSLFDSFKPIDVDQILADEAEDDNEEDDDDEKVNDLAKRPRFSLSGPYRYEVIEKNIFEIFLGKRHVNLGFNKKLDQVQKSTKN